MGLMQAVNMARISNHPPKLGTANLKKTALDHLRLDLRNRLEGLELEGNTSPEDEWRDLKDTFADASLAPSGLCHL